MVRPEERQATGKQLLLLGDHTRHDNLWCNNLRGGEIAERKI
jgi:hypothetical protein